MCFGLSEIEADILPRRFSPTPETLGQIAKTYGLTRERIRQLQVQGLKSLRQSKAYRNCRSAAASSLKTKGYLTRETAARCVHQILPTMNVDLSVAIGTIVFNDLIRGESRVYGDAAIRDRQIQMAVDDIQEYVNEAVIEHPVCTVDKVARMVRSDLKYAPLAGWVNEVVTDLWPILRRIADEKLAELRRKATASNLARTVVEEAGQPLHWTIVARNVNSRREYLGLSPLSENGIHNQLQSMKSLFAYAGPGTYGLREWGDDVPYIRGLIAEVLEVAGRPLTMTEIANEAAKKRVIKESSLTFYLSLDPDFYLSRSGKYGLPEWLDPNPTIRTSRDYVQELNDRKKRLNSSFAKQRQ